MVGTQIVSQVRTMSTNVYLQRAARRSQHKCNNAEDHREQRDLGGGHCAIEYTGPAVSIVIICFGADAGGVGIGNKSRCARVVLLVLFTVSCRGPVPSCIANRSSRPAAQANVLKAKVVDVPVVVEQSVELHGVKMSVWTASVTVRGATHLVHAGEFLLYAKPGITLDVRGRLEEFNSLVHEGADLGSRCDVIFAYKRLARELGHPATKVVWSARHSEQER